MARIYVQFAGLKELEEHCKAMPDFISAVNEDFQQTISQLDWDIKCKADIESRARRLAQTLDQQQQAMKAYSVFLGQAYQEYARLDDYQKQDSSSFIGKVEIDPRYQWKTDPSGSLYYDYDWKDFLGSFGVFGGLFSLVDQLFHAKDPGELPFIFQKIGQKLKTLSIDYPKYKKIGRAIGNGKAMANFFRKEAGLYQPGYASRAKSPVARFKNNLTNKTSAFNLKDAFGSYTGKNGVGAATAAWGGVILSGIGSFFGNLEEQKNSNGTMSTGRVIAETVSETAISTAGSIVATAVIGAAITAITGGVAAPAVVAIVGGMTMAGVNAGSEALFHKNFTEWASDLVLDGIETGAKAIGDGCKAIGDWFGKLWGG